MPQRQIIGIGGLPGAGKTTLRTTDPKIKDLPYLDVAEVYRQYPGIQPNDAFGELLGRLKKVFLKSDDVVIEATLFRNSTQRTWIEVMAQLYDASVSYIELNTPIHICRKRVKKQYEEVLATPMDEGERKAMIDHYQARLSILDYYEEPSS